MSIFPPSLPVWLLSTLMTTACGPQTCLKCEGEKKKVARAPCAKFLEVQRPSRPRAARRHDMKAMQKFRRDLHEEINITHIQRNGRGVSKISAPVADIRNAIPDRDLCVYITSLAAALAGSRPAPVPAALVSRVIFFPLCLSRESFASDPVFFLGGGSIGGAKASPRQTGPRPRSPAGHP